MNTRGIAGEMKRRWAFGKEKQRNLNIEMYICKFHMIGFEKEDYYGECFFLFAFLKFFQSLRVLTGKSQRE